MINCPRCKKENPIGIAYCGGCGAELKNNNGNYYTPPVKNPEETSAGFSEKDLQEREFSVRSQEEKGSLKKVSKDIHAILVIERGFAVGTKFYLTADDSYVGRWDADNGIFPDVDLDLYDPEVKVSRRHARIIKDGENYYIEDLGSTNGTFINRGKRLAPGVRQKLEDGDEIIIGKTFLRFYICKK